MKRSDMIYFMATRLILELIDYHIDLPYDRAQEVADKLLKSIEKEGMLPPEQRRTAIKNQTCEWEPEE